MSEPMEAYAWCRVGADGELYFLYGSDGSGGVFPLVFQERNKLEALRPVIRSMVMDQGFTAQLVCFNGLEVLEEVKAAVVEDENA